MRNLFLFSVVFIAILGLSATGKCNGKKYKRKIKRYKKCLKAGFPSKLHCESGDGKVTGRAAKKCKNAENRLKKCGYSCKVDGGWSDYEDWSTCTKTCGGGTQTRSRTCNNPSPANGGSNCAGSASESQNCNTHFCPVDGVWSDFSDWSECSSECCGGTQSRSRSCSNPAPANGGAECEGNAEETQTCNDDPCLEWKPVRKSSYIPHDIENVPLYIKTNSALGSAHYVWVQFFTQQKVYAGGFTLKLTNPAQFWVDCRSYTPFPVTLPEQQDKVWKISKTAGPGIVITVNDKEVLNTPISRSRCYLTDVGHWSKDVAMIYFHNYDTASDFYASGTSTC